jgi:hypothetical protein
MEAAMAAAKTFITTLHPKLQAFVQDLISGVLKDASKFHYKNEKLTNLHQQRIHPYNLLECGNDPPSPGGGPEDYRL